MQPQISVSSEFLKDRSFRLLLGGHSIASLGDWVATFGLMLYVRELTRGSAIEGLAISGILGFRILPAVIAAPIAASIVDRFDRRKTMISTHLLRAGLIAAVPFTPNLAAVYAIAFALEAVSLVFLPARDSVVPNIVRPERLAGANGLIMLTQWGAIPVAGGLVVAADAASQALATVPVIGFLAWQRFALPFFFNTFTFLVAAALVAALPAAVGRIAGRAGSEDSVSSHGLGSETTEGVRYLLAHPGRRSMLIGMALACGAGGALFALGIPYVKTTLGASDSVFGVLVALWGVGMALGALIAQRSKRSESDLFRIALGGSGAILIVMGVFPRTWLALAVSVGFGAGLAMAMVLGITYGQRESLPELRGRVMSAIHILARICLIGGAVIMGGIAAAMGRLQLPPGWDGNRWAFLLAGAALVAGGAAAMRGSARITADHTPTQEDREEVEGRAERRD